ncbi:glycosyltransferase family 2 protein [Elioraea sp.]|uniref:glycosyltransferase family 2 protein n=1 Tax=Elioraea sp. TaxID=2185103 RepID=UPI003F71D6AD
MTVRLSVVLPNYNHAALLPRALSALAAQERRADEIVLIDDASTDDSLAVAERFAARLPGLRVVRLERNGGAAAAIARGLTEVNGDLVYFAAADDVACPRLFARAAAALAAHPEAALASGEAVLRAPDDRVIGLRPVILPARQERFLPARSPRCCGGPITSSSRSRPSGDATRWLVRAGSIPRWARCATASSPASSRCATASCFFRRCSASGT